MARRAGLPPPPNSTLLLLVPNLSCFAQDCPGLSAERPAASPGQWVSFWLGHSSSGKGEGGFGVLIYLVLVCLFCCIMRLSGTLAPQFPAGTHGSQGQLRDVFLGGGGGSGPFLPAPLGSVQPCLSPICPWEGARKSISTLRSLFLKLCPQPLALKMKCPLHFVNLCKLWAVGRHMTRGSQM